LFLSSQKYAPDLDFLPIPDPVVKKAPDPGSGTLSMTNAAFVSVILWTRILIKNDFPEVRDGKSTGFELEAFALVILTFYSNNREVYRKCFLSDPVRIKLGSQPIYFQLCQIMGMTTILQTKNNI
jgi:hypothetical protein